MRFAAIIAAAGTGSRSGRAIPKQYVELLGSPVLAHTIRAFLRVPGCARVIVAIDEAWRGTAERCAPPDSPVDFVAGGAERQDSIAAALTLVPSELELVLVHDAARPCVSPELIQRVLTAAVEHGAALPAMPITETVKRVDEAGRVLETIPRQTLRAAQTPQGFRRELLARAYAHAREHALLGTDDASLVEALGEPVVVVDGEWTNLKITHDGDFARAEDWMVGRREERGEKREGRTKGRRDVGT